MTKLTVDAWSDIACPWCSIGKRRLEMALERFPHRDHVTVVWHAFELDPSAPKDRSASPSAVPHAKRLADKYGTSLAQAEAMIARVADTAKADGLDFRFDILREGNTFDAHRLVHLGKVLGLQGKVKERLFRAYFSEGERMGDTETLVRLGSECGLDAERVRAMLASDEFAADVRADEDAARQLGITGVPFFVLGARYAVSGAQPAQVMLQALERAWTDVAGAVSSPAEGATCGPEGAC